MLKNAWGQSINFACCIESVKEKFIDQNNLYILNDIALNIKKCYNACILYRYYCKIIHPIKKCMKLIENRNFYDLKFSEEFMSWIFYDKYVKMTENNKAGF